MKTGTRSEYGARGHTAREAGGAERIAALSALVESITEQIDAIEGASRRGIAARAPAPQPPVAERQPPYADRQSDRLEDIKAQLAAISSQIAERSAQRAAPPAAEPPPPVPASRPAGEAIGSLQAAIAEISARQKAIDLDNGRQLGAVDTIAIEDAITALRNDIATLGRRIGSEAARGEEFGRTLRDELAERFDRLPATAVQPDAGAFDEVRAHLAEIRQAIDLAARETTLASVESGYGHIIERLDDIVRRVPEGDRIDSLSQEILRLGAVLDRATPLRAIDGELEDIRNAIASLSTTRSDAATERQLSELRHAVEQLAAEPRETVDLSRIETELAAIRREIDDLARGIDLTLLPRIEQQVASIRATLDEGGAQGGSLDATAMSRLEERIDALAGRFDAIVDLPNLPTSSSAEAIDGLRSEISQLREHIVVREPIRFDAIDEQMRALMDRLDATVSRDDSSALSQLEAQVEALAEKFAGAGPGSDALAKVEENLDRLQALLGDTRRETIEAARDAARSTFQEFAETIPAGPDDSLIEALRGDLQNLQAAALHSDRQNHDTLEAVHDTLAKVVDRISQIEAGEFGATERSFTAPRAPGRTGRAERMLDVDAPEDHRPLAPGSGKPDLSATRDAPSQAPGPRPSDRKADFIAAARRAAQAAQAETMKARSEEKSAGPAEDRQGPLARIGNVLRSRRRPLALALAAVVLALGAAQYGPTIGQRIADATRPGPALDPTTTSSVKPVSSADVPDAAKPVRSAMPAATVPTETHAEAPVPDPAATSGLVAPNPDGGAMAFQPAEPIASRFMSAPDAPATAGFAPAIQAINISLVETAAAKGDAVAAFEMAKHLAEGTNGRGDLKLAAQWYERAAKGGLAMAQYRLGSLYERGEGVKRDTQTAQRWYERASAGGNARAVHNLAVLLSEGANGKPDYVRAVTLFVEAAEMDVADSQYNLGVLYARGLGVRVDLTESYKWFALAAQQGDTDAAKRRDEVAKAMTADQLAGARAAVQAFKPKPLDAAANSEPTPKPEWMQTATQATLFNGASLTDSKG